MSAPYREPTYVGDLDEPRCSYPVIVTDTREHVIWVQADSLEQAIERARHDTYELLDDSETLATAGLSVRKPGDDFHSYDWETVYEGDYYGTYQGRKFDEHVETTRRHFEMLQREADKAACTERGHPEAKPRYWSKERPTRLLCSGPCGWLDADQPAPSAVGGEPQATTKESSDLGGGS